VLQCCAVSCSELQAQFDAIDTVFIKQVWYRGLPCAALCCSVLHCVAVCCIVLQCAALCCSVLFFAAELCRVSLCVASAMAGDRHYLHQADVLQCSALCCVVLRCIKECCVVLQCIAALQCAAVCCNVTPVRFDAVGTVHTEQVPFYCTTI